jgi:phage baseplate assembly protein W
MPQSQIIQLRGLALPALKGTGGYFASRTRYDVGWGDLILAIFTPINARPMRRTFGSALHNVLFEPSTLALEQLCNYVIRDAAQRWTPHVIINSVEVKLSGEEVALGIRFSLLEDRLVETRLIQIKKSDVIKLLASYRVPSNG